MDLDFQSHIAGQFKERFHHVLLPYYENRPEDLHYESIMRPSDLFHLIRAVKTRVDYFKIPGICRKNESRKPSQKFLKGKILSFLHPFGHSSGAVSTVTDTRSSIGVLHIVDIFPKFSATLSPLRLGKGQGAHCLSPLFAGIRDFGFTPGQDHYEIRWEFQVILSNGFKSRIRCLDCIDAEGGLRRYQIFPDGTTLSNDRIPEDRTRHDVMRTLMSQVLLMECVPELDPWADMYFRAICGKFPSDTMSEFGADELKPSNVAQLRCQPGNRHHVNQVNPHPFTGDNCRLPCEPAVSLEIKA